MPEKETEGTFSGQFLTPFFVRPLSENSFKAKNPSLFAKIRPKGGCAIPARAVFWGFLAILAKKRQKSALSLYGEVLTRHIALRGHIWGVAVAERVSAVRERPPSVEFMEQRSHKRIARRPLVKNSCQKKRPKGLFLANF